MLLSGFNFLQIGDLAFFGALISRDLDTLGWGPVVKTFKGLRGLKPYSGGYLFGETFGCAQFFYGAPQRGLEQLKEGGPTKVLLEAEFLSKFFGVASSHKFFGPYKVRILLGF